MVQTSAEAFCQSDRVPPHLQQLPRFAGAASGDSGVDGVRRVDLSPQDGGCFLPLG